jgi:hypothetical protein
VWVTQQNRNLVWQLEGSPIRLLMYDHDAKFEGPSDVVFQTRPGGLLREYSCMPAAAAA